MKVGVIRRDGAIVVPQTWLANRPWSRLRGLLARPRLHGDALQALWLQPCGSIHTVGMSYPLDVVFLDRAGRVVDWCEGLRPWRARRCRGSTQTIELAPGGIATLAPVCGEIWTWQGT